MSSILGAIGGLFGAGGDVQPEYQVDQTAYGPSAGSYTTQAALMQALQQSQNRAAPQAVGGYNAALSGNVNLAPAQMAAYQTGPTSIDATQANQAAGQQAQLAAMQLAQASGQGPSVAQQQMTLGNQQNQNALLSAAGSLRGGANPALQQRQLMDTLATSNQQNNANASIARTQEELNAQQAAGSTLGTSRDQSLNQATTNANLGQQAANQYNTANQYNAGQANQFALQAGSMLQANNQYNAGAQNTASQADLNQSLANAQLQQAQYGQNTQSQLGAIGQLQQQNQFATQTGIEGQQAQQNAYGQYVAAKNNQSYNNAQFAGNLLNSAGQGAMSALGLGA